MPAVEHDIFAWGFPSCGWEYLGGHQCSWRAQPHVWSWKDHACLWSHQATWFLWSELSHRAQWWKVWSSFSWHIWCLQLYSEAEGTQFLETNGEAARGTETYLCDGSELQLWDWQGLIWCRSWGWMLFGMSTASELELHGTVDFESLLLTHHWQSHHGLWKPEEGQSWVSIRGWETSCTEIGSLSPFLMPAFHYLTMPVDQS